MTVPVPVNMTVTAIEPRRLPAVEKALLDIEQLKSDKLIDDNLFYKLLVSLAYEFVMNEEPDRGFELLCRCPNSYYKDTQYAQMVEDPLYRDVVIRLTYGMIQSGYIVNQEEEEYTEPTVKA